MFYLLECASFLIKMIHLMLEYDIANINERSNVPFYNKAEKLN